MIVKRLRLFISLHRRCYRPVWFILVFTQLISSDSTLPAVSCLHVVNDTEDKLCDGRKSRTNIHCSPKLRHSVGLKLWSRSVSLHHTLPVCCHTKTNTHRSFTEPAERLQLWRRLLHFQHFTPQVHLLSKDVFDAFTGTERLTLMILYHIFEAHSNVCRLQIQMWQTLRIIRKNIIKWRIQFLILAIIKEFKSASFPKTFPGKKKNTYIEINDCIKNRTEVSWLWWVYADLIWLTLLLLNY